MRILLSYIIFIVCVGFGAMLYVNRYGADGFSDVEMQRAALLCFLFIAAALVVKPRRKPAPQTYFNTRDDSFRDAEFEAMKGEETRIGPRPAWDFSLRSPFAEDPPGTSWFGGLPHLPPDRFWPVDHDGKPMHFVLQIDLAAVSGPKPAALAETGAMLLFVSFRRGGGENTYSVLQLTPDEMRASAPRPAPKDLAPLSEAGFFDGGRVFPHWPLDLHHRMDTGQGHAPAAPAPETWITNWGIALDEAQTLQKARESDDRLRERFDRDMAKRDANAPPLPAFKEKEARHHATMRRLGPAFYDALDAFIAKAAQMRPETPIDPVDLSQMLSSRRELALHLDSYPIRTVLEPNRRSFVLNRLALSFDETTGQLQEDVLANVPPHLVPLVSNFISEPRPHRLFGRTLPPSEDPVELRGMECLVMIRADKLMGTQTDHEDGFSIWCPSPDLADGDLFSGKLVWHTNV